MVSELVGGLVSGLMSGLKRGVSAWVSTWISTWVSAWVSAWVSEWVHTWVRTGEWVIVRRLGHRLLLLHRQGARPREHRYDEEHGQGDGDGEEEGDEARVVARADAVAREGAVVVEVAHAVVAVRAVRRPRRAVDAAGVAPRVRLRVRFKGEGQGEGQGFRVTVNRLGYGRCGAQGQGWVRSHAPCVCYDRAVVVDALAVERRRRAARAGRVGVARQDARVGEGGHQEPEDRRREAGEHLWCTTRYVGSSAGAYSTPCASGTTGRRRPAGSSRPAGVPRVRAARLRHSMALRVNAGAHEGEEW